MSLTRLFLFAGALAVMLAAAPFAQAQDCKTTAQCPQGFVCELSPVGKPEPAPACAPNAACPVADPATGMDLIAVTGWCRPAPCTKDSECGPTQVCYTQTISSCSGGGSTGVACAPNTKCDAPVPEPVVPPTCTDTKVSTCAFKWQLPCSADTDCGAGFNCMPAVTGTCSSGSGTTGSGTVTPGTGAAAPNFVAPPPDNCTTTTSFPGYCQPKATTCTANTDCPTDFTCVAAPTPATSDPARPASGGTGGAAGSGAAAPAIFPAPPPSDTKICQSPYGYDTRVDSPTSSDPKTGGTGGPGGGAGGTTGTATGGNASPPTESASTPKAGCAVATGTPGAGAPLVLGSLALLGLVLARRRRRR